MQCILKENWNNKGIQQPFFYFSFKKKVTQFWMERFEIFTNLRDAYILTFYITF